MSCQSCRGCKGLTPWAKAQDSTQCRDGKMEAAVCGTQTQRRASESPLRGEKLELRKGPED